MSPEPAALAVTLAGRYAWRWASRKTSIGERPRPVDRHRAVVDAVDVDDAQRCADDVLAGDRREPGDVQRRGRTEKVASTLSRRSSTRPDRRAASESAAAVTCGLSANAAPARSRNAWASTCAARGARRCEPDAIATHLDPVVTPPRTRPPASSRRWPTRTSGRSSSRARSVGARRPGTWASCPSASGMPASEPTPARSRRPDDRRSPARPAREPRRGDRSRCGSRRLEVGRQPALGLAHRCASVSAATSDGRRAVVRRPLADPRQQPPTIRTKPTPTAHRRRTRR